MVCLHVWSVGNLRGSGDCRALFVETGKVCREAAVEGIFLRLVVVFVGVTFHGGVISGHSWKTRDDGGVGRFFWYPGAGDTNAEGFEDGGSLGSIE